MALFLLLHAVGYAQFRIDWQQSYGTMASDIAYDIVQVDDGYFVTGFAGAGGGQVTCSKEGAGWLLRFDSSGNLLWQRCYPRRSAIRMVKAIGSPYFYMIGGCTLDPYPDTYNLWIAKIDSLGSILWERVLGNTIGILGGDQYGEATPDGGVIASAQIDSQGGDITHWHGWYDGWVIKLDSLGNTEWDQSIGSSFIEFINVIIPTSDGGYLAGLYGEPNGIDGNVECVVFSNDADAIVYKMDSTGNRQWDQCYGGSALEGVVNLLEVEDGYLVAGIGSSTDGDLLGAGWHPGWEGNHYPDPTIDIWLVKIDFHGNIIWQKCYGGTQNESSRKIFQSEDGGFVIFGETHSFDCDVEGNPSCCKEKPSIWIFKVDPMGNFLWQQCIGGSGSESLYNGVVRHSDYRYVVAGEMNYSPSGDVNCSNFVPLSGPNFWVFSISDTTENIAEHNPWMDKVNIYPNPTSAVLHIDFPANTPIPHALLEILDINGRVVLKQEKLSHTNNLAIEQLPPGLFLVRIRDDARLMTKRIIRKNL